MTAFLSHYYLNRISVKFQGDSGGSRLELCLVKNSIKITLDTWRNVNFEKSMWNGQFFFSFTFSFFLFLFFFLIGRCCRSCCCSQQDSRHGNLFTSMKAAMFALFWDWRFTILSTKKVLLFFCRDRSANFNS